MTSAEIRRKIQYYENLMYSHHNSIRQLENQINQLQRLRGKVQTLQNNFGNKQSYRKSRLSQLFSTTLNVKMISKYRTAMNQLLTGAEYSNAYNGLSSAQERVNSKIRSVQNEINTYNNQISNCRRQINYWKNQMQYAQDPL